MRPAAASHDEAVDPIPATPRRVIITGSGGREHALAWSLARERDVECVIVAPGSDGIADEFKVRCAPGVPATDPAAIVALARAEEADLVVLGPEASVAAGVADALTEAGIVVFGPTADAGRMESSKAFCHEIAEAAGVRMARAGSFEELIPALEFARSLVEAPGSCGVVIKADGLMLGKGVTVCDDLPAAERALHALLVEHAGGQTRVVVEERLVGAEASLIAICDGQRALGLPAARDHKRLLDADLGPNTGGMGAYSPVPDLPDGLCATLLDVIHLPILAELDRRGVPFRGALYAGLMLTPEGPVLLETNARFGDPETQAILPRLAVPLGPLLLGAARGDLSSAAAELGLQARLLPITGDAAVAIVLAAEHYPDSPVRGDAISGLDEAAATGALVFHAGTKRGPEGFVTNGGRCLAVVGLGDSIGAARAQAEAAADRVVWRGMQRRHDIAERLPVPEAPAEARPKEPRRWPGTEGATSGNRS